MKARLILPTLLSLLAILFVASLLIACTSPKMIDGKRVKATRWVNGRVVYILEDDTQRMEQQANEAREAAKDVRFVPTK